MWKNALKAKLLRLQLLSRINWNPMIWRPMHLPGLTFPSPAGCLSCALHAPGLTAQTWLQNVPHAALLWVAALWTLPLSRQFAQSELGSLCSDTFRCCLEREKMCRAAVHTITCKLTRGRESYWLFWSILCSKKKKKRGFHWSRTHKCSPDFKKDERLDGFRCHLLQMKVAAFFFFFATSRCSIDALTPAAAQARGTLA